MVGRDMKRRNILLGAAAGGVVALAGIWLPPGPALAEEMALITERFCSRTKCILRIAVSCFGVVVLCAERDISN